MSTAARVIKQVTVSSAIGAAMLAATATSAFADTAPPVSAAAHVRYSMSGTTASITPYLTGTQHAMQDLDGSLVKSALPESFSVQAPATAKWASGNAAGDSGEMTCGTTGSVPLTSAPLSADPIVLTFPGPGTYPVTLTAHVCTPQGSVTKTVNITIPAAGKVAPAKIGSVAPQGVAGPNKDALAKQHTAGQPSAPVVKGPHVETDGVSRGSDSSMLWGLAGLAGLSALGGSSLLAARRRR